MTRFITSRQALKNILLTGGSAAPGIKGFSQADDNLSGFRMNSDGLFRPAETPLKKPVTAAATGR